MKVVLQVHCEPIFNTCKDYGCDVGGQVCTKDALTDRTFEVGILLVLGDLVCHLT